MTANAETLMRQAPMTADTYLRECVKSIDSQFGQGFAKANPAVLAAMLQASSMDFASMVISNSFDRVAVAIEDGLTSR
jgi:hypothetical protein